MSSKTIPKASALERVGNFVAATGGVQMIEYSDLPESLANQTNARRFAGDSTKDRSGFTRYPWR